MTPNTDLTTDQIDRLEDRARFVRLETIRLIGIAKVGHYSSVFSCAEIFSALYCDVMSLSDDPAWPLRDRFLMGKGHAAVGLFPILADKWRAFGWELHEVDGHDIVALTQTLRRIKADTGRDRPACLIAQAVKGKGIGYMETEPGWHLGYLSPEDSEKARQTILSTRIRPQGAAQ